MNEKQFLDKMKKLETSYYKHYHDKMVDTVLTYIKDNPDYHSMPYSLDNSIDVLALDRAWIEDRLNGKTLDSKRSMRKNIRKALGYSIP